MCDWPQSFKENIKALLDGFSNLFADVPSCTTLIACDIDVADHAPIRLHHSKSF